jgi:hypothetical protein
MKKLLTVLSLGAFLATAAAGCKKKEEATKPADKPAEPAAAPTPAPAPAPAPTEPAKTEEAKPAEGAAAAPAAGGTGIAECDEYVAQIEKLAKCDKMPAEAKKPLQDAADAQKASWAGAKDMPAEGKAGLATGCKTGADAVKQAMTAAGCQ